MSNEITTTLEPVNPMTVSAILNQNNAMDTTNLPFQLTHTQFCHLGQALPIGQSYSISVSDEIGATYPFMFPCMPRATDAYPIYALQAAYSRFYTCRHRITFWAVKAPAAPCRLRVALHPDILPSPDIKQRSTGVEWDLSATDTFTVEVTLPRRTPRWRTMTEDVSEKEVVPPFKVVPVTSEKDSLGYFHVVLTLANAYLPGSIFPDQFNVYAFYEPLELDFQLRSGLTQQVPDAGQLTAFQLETF